MIILDTETTGLLAPSVSDPNKQPRIIDFAAVKIDPMTGAETDRYQTLLNPGVPLPEEITKITGYRDEDLKDAPTFEHVLPQLAEFFLGERAMLAHNLPFDHGLMRWELVRSGAEFRFPWPPMQLCSVQLFEAEFGRRMKLVQLYKAKLGRDLDQKHTAMADVEALLEIVRAERLYELELADVAAHAA